MGWQQKGSGRAYNSNSGHYLDFGALSKSVIAFCVLAKICSTCNSQKSDVMKEHRCPKNYEGSSKAMEPTGAVMCATLIFRDTTNNPLVKPMYLDTVIMDDDTSTGANLTK